MWRSPCGSRLKPCVVDQKVAGSKEEVYLCDRIIRAVHIPGHPSFASTAVAAGQGLPMIGKLLGHTQVAQIMDARVLEPSAGANALPERLQIHEPAARLDAVDHPRIAGQGSLGTGSIIRPGEIQRMSAGTGIRHSEFNASTDSPVHFLQIWIVPERRGFAPSYQQAELNDAERRGRLGLAAVEEGRGGALSLHRDVDIYTSLLAAGESVRHPARPGRLAWLQVARGGVALNGHVLATGDGAAARDEPALEINATGDAEILLFDMR